MSQRIGGRQLHIEAPRLEDASRLNQIRGAGWRQAYARLPGVSPEWLAAEIDTITDAYANALRVTRIIDTQDKVSARHYRVARLVDTRGRVSPPIGFIEGRKGVIFQQQAFQELHTLQVVRRYQSHGIGSLLLRQLDEWLDPTQPTMVQVAHETPARGFYERHGFEDCGLREDFGPVLMNIMIRPPQLTLGSLFTDKG